MPRRVTSASSFEIAPLTLENYVDCDAGLFLQNRSHKRKFCDLIVCKLRTYARDTQAR